MLTVVWVVMMPVAILTGWIYLTAFISVVSIYANAVSHWGAYQAWRAARKGRKDKAGGKEES